MITRPYIKDNFEKYTAGQYIYYDSMVDHGLFCVKVKCISRKTNHPLIIEYRLLPDDAVDWAQPIVIRRVNHKKDF